ILIMTDILQWSGFHHQSEGFPTFNFLQSRNPSNHHEFPTVSRSFGSGTGHKSRGFPTLIFPGRETGPLTRKSRPLLHYFQGKRKSPAFRSFPEPGLFPAMFHEKESL
ncbi:MAG: hypothetical protein ACFNYI_03635, partial [Eubacterium sp.]